MKRQRQGRGRGRGRGRDGDRDEAEAEAEAEADLRCSCVPYRRQAAGWGRLHCCLVGVVGGWGRGSSPFLKKQKTNYTIPEFLRPSMAGPRGTGGGSRLVIIRPQQLVTVTGDNFAPVHSALGPNTGQTRTLRHYAPRHVACLIGDD